MQLLTTPAYASGLTTSQSSQPGQVLVRSDNGTLYLTTQTNGTGSATTNSRLTFQSPLENFRVVIPRGFANNFSGFMNGTISFVMVISALLVFFYLIWGSFDWITSGGDKAKTEKARSKIVSAIIGLIIVSASYAVLNLAIGFLGFTDINDVFRSAGTVDGPGPGGSTTTGTNSLRDLLATPSAQPK